jgi:uncharacterized membrane protein YidH (DUF202 family)
MQPDAGLQPERTRLSWTRTRLAIAAAALVVGRHPLTDGRVTATGVVLLCGLALVVIFLGVGLRAASGSWTALQRLTACTAALVTVCCIEVLWLTSVG